MFIIRRNTFIISIALFLLFSIPLKSQDSVMIQSVKRFSGRINQIENQLKRNNDMLKVLMNKNEAYYDSIAQNNIENLDKVLFKFEQEFNQQKNQIEFLKEQLNKNHTESIEITKWQTIIITIAIVLIALLIVITIQMRRNTINYLLSESKKLIDNQEEIQDKAESLQRLSIEIAKEILNQKKAIKKQRNSIRSSHDSLIEKLQTINSKKKKK